MFFAKLLYLNFPEILLSTRWMFLLFYSPINTRPHTPKSDTEVDRQKSIESQEALHYGEETTLWEWGGLPRKSVTDETLADQVRHSSPEGISEGMHA